MAKRKKFPIELLLAGGAAVAVGYWIWKERKTAAGFRPSGGGTSPGVPGGLLPDFQVPPPPEPTEAEQATPELAAQAWQRIAERQFQARLRDIRRAMALGALTSGTSPAEMKPGTAPYYHTRTFAQFEPTSAEGRGMVTPKVYSRYQLSAGSVFTKGLSPEGLQRYIAQRTEARKTARMVAYQKRPSLFRTKEVVWGPAPRAVLTPGFKTEPERVVTPGGEPFRSGRGIRSAFTI